MHRLLNLLTRFHARRTGRRGKGGLCFPMPVHPDGKRNIIHSPRITRHEDYAREKSATTVYPCFQCLRIWWNFSSCSGSESLPIAPATPGESG